MTSDSSAGRCYAHSRPGEPPERWEPLEVHLREVAELAADFAGTFGAAEWGRLAGLWHDLGKYQPEFQARLRGERIAVEHAGAGAALAFERGLVPLAFAIAGHHAGLANFRAQGDVEQRPLIERVKANAPILAAVRPSVPLEVLDVPVPALPPRLQGRPDPDTVRALEMWTRFVFSALVDADYLATERFLDGQRSAARGPAHSLVHLRDRLDAHLRRFTPDSPVNRVRADVLNACRAAAHREPGLFSLTVPTGGGKTLSSMAFALDHAVRYGLARVIVAVPYTTIIEQNAMVYREILGNDAVIEHHSNVDEDARVKQLGETEIRRRLACENWDAPIIVTTNVQLFESLFANRPGRCRKLHRIARSVLILDEAQSLPADFLLPAIDAIRELCTNFGCSVVLSTATQPALQKRETLPAGLDNIREIVQSPSELAQRLERVSVTWPSDGQATPYEELARRIASESQVLAIVHRRHDARRLAELIPEEDRFHLSALMCPAHRLEILQEVRRRLKAGEPCRLVSTQLVEAGVDIDFPVVFRALGGLDSVVQAAGRCNREGKLTGPDGVPLLGRFEVFRAPTAPPADLARGLRVAEAMLNAHGGKLSLNDPCVMEEYFRRLYHATNLDRANVQMHRKELDFATVGAEFRLIADVTTAVIVPWGDSAKRLASYRAHPSREALRALQPYLVQVYPASILDLQQMGAVENVANGLVAIMPTYAHLYHEAFGLLLGADAPMPDPGGLVAQYEILRPDRDRAADY